MHSDELIDLAGDGDAGLAENVRNLSLAKTGSVVFEGELILLLVDAKAAETVGIGEFAQAAELFEAQRGLQFVSNFEESHSREYTVKRHTNKRAPEAENQRLTPIGDRGIYRARGYME